MKKILIVSAPVKSGKTTHLLEWAKTQNNIDGIAQPVINGKRHLLHLGTGEKRMLEIPGESSAEKIYIGNYIFDEAAFRWGREKLKESLQNSPEFLIVDEIGKLELHGKGLEPEIGDILRNENFPNANIILVIREYLLEEVIKKYGLENRCESFNIK
jgi:nucleoside-triphosphatase THEP1